MKIAPISADLLVKIALLAGAGLLVLYLVRRSTDAVSGVFEAAGEAVGAAWADVQDVADSVIVGVNPSNPSNWVNQAVSSAGAAVVSPTGPGRNADGSWTLGGWLYDVTHADPVGPAMVGTSTPADLRTIAARGRVVGGL